MITLGEKFEALMINIFSGKIFETKEADNRMTLTEFANKYSLRFKRVVESCHNEQELEVAENYIKAGLKTQTINPESDNAFEYVRILIASKKQELEKIYEDGLKELS